MIYLYIFLISIISGILYRFGGWGGSGRDEHPGWPGWLFDTKARDIGCAICAIGAAAAIGISAVWWAYLLAFLLTFGACTTYHDEMFYNWMKSKDNHWIHGFVIGLAFSPIAIVTGGWFPFLLRSLVLAILMGLWSLYNPPVWNWGEDVTEEFGRGFLIPITMLFYLI